MRNQKPETRNQSGQALLELSIFGAIILMLLGLLISYGLRYNFQQEAQMETFRKALEIAAEDDDGQVRGSASYSLIKDRHIPSPENPFGVGSVQPIMASASVTRDSQSDATADDYGSLPKMRVSMQGRVNGQLVEQTRSLATAGIRKEDLRLPDSEDDYNTLKEKYSLIYGSFSGLDCDFEPSSKKKEKKKEKQEERRYDKHCAGEPRTVVIVDSCEGEVVDYNSAVRQARLIVDNDFCVDQCELGKKSDSETDCEAVCNYPIQSPWYVDGAYQQDDEWVFPEIEKLFYLPVAGGSSKRVQAMGLQSDYTQQTTTDFAMHKTEDDTGITTRDDVDWNTTTTRTFLYSDHLDKDKFNEQGEVVYEGTGEAQSLVNLETEDYSTTRSEQDTTSWQTRWGAE